MLIRISAIPVVVALGFSWAAYKELALALKCDDQAQTLTCAKLIADGPGKNAHVVLTDFVRSGTFLRRKQGFLDRVEKWDFHGAWVPVVPQGASVEVDASKNRPALTGSTAQSPPIVPVILYLPDAHHKSEVEAIDRASSLEGVVVNGLESIPLDSLRDEERKALAAEFPGANLGNCLLIDVGREGGSIARFACYCAAALASLGLSAFLALRRQARGSAKAEAVERYEPPGRSFA